MFKIRKESDTYLATARRHRWSEQITMKMDKILYLIYFSSFSVYSSDVYGQ